MLDNLKTVSWFDDKFGQSVNILELRKFQIEHQHRTFPFHLSPTAKYFFNFEESILFFSPNLSSIREIRWRGIIRVPAQSSGTFTLVISNRAKR